ncbi:GNAT family N-acetyltransferase [Chloroflexi bacterium TSY]|nr:GNAT family N-acetyltransferase [Chloroflexi bacterium TSY]
MKIDYRQLTKDEIWLACDIDIAETGNLVYRFRSNELETEEKAWDRPNWSVEHWQENLKDWRDYVGIDCLYGAFVDGQIVGMTSLRYPREDGVALLVSIHVTREYRRGGIGQMLFQQILERARERGAKAIGVYAVPTDSAIGFYLAQGFRPRSVFSDDGNEETMEDIYMECQFK